MSSSKSSLTPKSSITLSLVSSDTTENDSTHTHAHHAHRAKSDPALQHSRPSSSKVKHNRRHPSDDTKSVKKEILYDGPLAHAEFERLKRENESLKKQIHDQKKVVKKQKKLVEDLKSDLSRKAEAETELQAIRTGSRVTQELVSSIETSVQCQICMDILLKPYVLSPCGHVLCVDCLASWFRQAPVSAMDQDETDLTSEELQQDPEYIKHRDKSCPTCRATVVRRPEPVFVVKSVAAAIAKAKAEMGNRVPNHHLLEEPTSIEDPWKDLFPDSDEEATDSSDGGIDSEDEAYIYGLVASDDSDEEGSVFYDIHSPQLHPSALDSDEDEVYDDRIAVDEDEFHARIPANIINGPPNYTVLMDDDHSYHSSGGSRHRSPSPMEEYGSFVRPSWEPPHHRLSPLAADSMDANELNLRRRGCTLGMIDTFSMTYSHEHGIVAHVASLDEDRFVPGGSLSLRRACRLFLGWNVELEDDDEHGIRFIHDALRHLDIYPESWEVERRPGSGGNASDAFKLAQSYNLDYSTTDTDHYQDDDDEMEEW